MSEKIPKIILDGTMNRGVENSPEPAGAIRELIDQKLVPAIVDYINAAEARKRAEIDYEAAILAQGAIAHTYAYKDGAAFKSLDKARVAQEQATQKIMLALEELYVRLSSLRNSDPEKSEKFERMLELLIPA